MMLTTMMMLMVVMVVMMMMMNRHDHYGSKDRNADDVAPLTPLAGVVALSVQIKLGSLASLEVPH